MGAMVKTLVILANSIRESHRCVTGKELIPRGPKYDVKGWIRLAHPETERGAVPVESTICADGASAAVLDIVEVKVLGPCADPNHPEDWHFDPRAAWKRIRSVPGKGLAKLADKPPSLWKHGKDSRHVPEGYVSEMPEPASLYLVGAPKDWHVYYWKERVDAPEQSGKFVNKTRRRLSFRYGEHYHEFEITDPAFIERYALFENAKEDEYQEVGIERREGAYFCLSLTPEWQGRHYKIAATIFESHA